MTDCEQFEREYPLLMAGGLPAERAEEQRRHASACPLCAKMTPDIARTRGILAKMPVLEPAPGFEARLQRRIRDGGSSPARRFNLFPRWAALGVGLASGLAIGIMLLLPSPTGRDKSALIAPSAPSGVVAASDAGNRTADSLQDNADSGAAKSPGYDINRKSQMVSSGR